MKLIIWIALRFRLRHKIFGDMFMWFQRKQVQKFIDDIDLDVKDIKLIQK